MAYTPKPMQGITTLEQLLSYLEDELGFVSFEFSETQAVELRQSARAPTRPREGMIVSADGTNWNPGAGAGAYEYKGGAWVKL